jgi:hypothetical protein
LGYFYATEYVYNAGSEHYKDNDIVLADIGFTMVSDKRDSEELYKMKELAHILYLILFIYMSCDNKHALAEFAISCAIVLLTKNVLFASTILPDPSQKCEKFKLSKAHNGSCHDLVISTHCTLSIISFYTIIRHGIGGNIFAWFSGSYNLWLIYSILSLRQHYTMDILNAIIYGFFVNSYVSNKISKLDNATQ